MSLRWKLMLAFVFIAATATGVVGILSYQTTHSRLMTEIDRSLVQATNRFLGRSGRDRPNNFGEEGLINIPDRPLGIEQYVVQVTGIDGGVLGATAGVSLPIFTEDANAASSADGAFESVQSAQGVHYRVRTLSIQRGAKKIGSVQVGRDLGETDNVLADLRRSIFLLGSGVAVVAGLVGLVISASITARLRKLSMAVEHISSTGRLDIDSPVNGRDETGRLGRSFREMLATLARSKEQQQRLVEDAGHELRTPLTSLRTNLDVLKRHPDLQDVTREQILVDIDRDTADLAALVEEVVALAADRHTDELPQPLEIKEVVINIADRASRRSGRVINVLGDTSMVFARHQMFDRAVWNLIDNALKFDTSGGAIEVEVIDGKVIVRDNGPGVPEEELALIFERFHRSPQSRTLPGSGLGLAIVAQVAQAHGGGVFARNRPGGGAEIGFSLPTVQDLSTL